MTKHIMLNLLKESLSKMVKGALKCSYCPTAQNEVTMDSTPEGWFVQCCNCKRSGPTCANVDESKSHWNNMQLDAIVSMSCRPTRLKFKNIAENINNLLA